MTYELILTSVSQGLDPNKRGFCPVAESGTLSPPLVACLTSISNYRHLFAPDSEDSIRNPIVYSHVVVSVLETSFHVLSRIADHGTDFQHAPNCLAHHVVLQAEEHVPEGPAWILAQSGFHFTEWLTPAVRFFQGRPLPTLTAPPSPTRLQRIDKERQRLDAQKMAPSIGSPLPNSTELPPQGKTPCPFWKRLTGDPGWGGVLAATVRTGRPAALLFKPSVNVLPLFVESLALLPSEMRWKATFSTCFTGYPEYAVCQWKAVPVGSPEADQLQEDSTVLLIDLTKPFPKAPDGPYVKFARHGTENTLPENETPVESLEDRPELSDDIEASPPETASDIAEPSDQSKPSPVAVPLIRIQTSSSKTPVKSFLNMKSRRAFYTIVAATFLCVLLLSAVVVDQLFGIGIFHSPLKSTKAKEEATPPPKLGAERPKPPPEEETQPDPAAEMQRQAGEQKQRALEQRQQRKENAERAWKELAEKKEAAKEELDRFLDEFPSPNNLSFHVPSPDDPAKSQLFPEFVELHRFGAAIHFEFFPLLQNPRIRFETRWIPCFLNAESQAIEEVEEDERMPDPNRFEWHVLGVTTDSDHEVPLLLLKLTAEGLSIDWLDAAFAPQYFDAVALLPFGFLRYRVENVTDVTKIRSVPLFVSKIVDAVWPVTVFSDPEKPTFDVPTPLAGEPWKSIFESGNVDYSLRLEVAVPEKPSGVTDIEFREESPNRILANVETTVTSTRNDGPGRDSQHPIVVPFEIIAEPDAVRWADRYADQRETLIQEREGNQGQIDKIVKEHNSVAQQLLNIGNRDSSELRRQRNELNESRQRLGTRNREIDSILDRLPSAHDKVVKNEEFRFEYSLFLLPKEEENADTAPLRLKNEEAVRLMGTPMSDTGN